jgi:hypothetical protein
MNTNVQSWTEGYGHRLTSRAVTGCCKYGLRILNYLRKGAATVQRCGLDCTGTERGAREGFLVCYEDIDWIKLAYALL